MYTSSGMIKGFRVMKIGKANNIKQRQQQIKLNMDCHCRLANENQAFEVEHELRDLVRKHGGRQYLDTNDWFMFDPKIHEVIKMELETIANSVEKKSQEFIEGYTARVEEEVATLKEELAEIEARHKREVLNLELRKLQEERNVAYLEYAMTPFRNNPSDETYAAAKQAIDLIYAGWTAPPIKPVE